MTLTIVVGVRTIGSKNSRSESYKSESSYSKKVELLFDLCIILIDMIAEILFEAPLKFGDLT